MNAEPPKQRGMHGKFARRILDRHAPDVFNHRAWRFSSVRRVRHSQYRIVCARFVKCCSSFRLVRALGSMREDLTRNQFETPKRENTHHRKYIRDSTLVYVNERLQNSMTEKIRQRMYASRRSLSVFLIQSVKLMVKIRLICSSERIWKKA